LVRKYYSQKAQPSVSILTELKTQSPINFPITSGNGNTFLTGKRLVQKKNRHRSPRSQTHTVCLCILSTLQISRRTLRLNYCVYINFWRQHKICRLSKTPFLLFRAAGDNFPNCKQPQLSSFSHSPLPLPLVPNPLPPPPSPPSPLKKQLFAKTSILSEKFFLTSSRLEEKIPIRIFS